MIETDDAQLVAEIGARWLDSMVARLFANGPSVSKPSAYHTLSWAAHLSRADSKILLRDLQVLGVVEIGRSNVILRRRLP